MEITRPTADVEIVTDLNALRQAIDLANSIPAEGIPDGLTEAEEAATMKAVKQAHSKLKAAVAKVDDSTIILTLRGLPSSEWNQIVVACTTMRGAKAERDPHAMLVKALPQMVESARYKNGETIQLDSINYETLPSDLMDTQELDLLTAMQSLNSPIATIPKALREML